MPDDPDFLDLMSTSEISEPPEPPETHRRNGIQAFLLAAALIIPVALLGFAFSEYPGVIEIISMIGYSIAITYIASDRYLDRVPWDLLTRPKFLSMHSIALAAVCGFTFGAFQIRSQLPPWMLVSGRRGSFFGICYFLLLVVMAFCECFWSDLLP